MLSKMFHFKLGVLAVCREHIFSSPCQRQRELLPSLGVRRPLTFHILIDAGLQMDIVVILDFSKAFDTAPHKKLLSKMGDYGIRGPIYNRQNIFSTNYVNFYYNFSVICI
jgi:hypothetical protein